MAWPPDPSPRPAPCIFLVPRGGTPEPDIADHPSRGPQRMTPTGLARTAVIAVVLAGASLAHAATIEREFQYGADRLKLTSRDGLTELTASRAFGELRA